jgi:hypothetical protein
VLGLWKIDATASAYCMPIFQSGEEILSGWIRTCGPDIEENDVTMEENQSPQRSLVKRLCVPSTTCWRLVRSVYKWIRRVTVWIKRYPLYVLGGESRQPL